MSKLASGECIELTTANKVSSQEADIYTIKIVIFFNGDVKYVIYVFKQISVPPLLTIWNTVRTTAQSVVVGRRNARASSLSVSTKTEEPVSAIAVKETV